MSVATTSKGTALPMIKLKGKDYLLIAHRLLWLNDDFKNFTIDTNVLQVTEDYAVVRAEVKLLDETGKVIRSATASKRETKSDFADFLEKAETGSVGRALAMIGIGTQFAQQDMEEGMRLADAPLDPPPKRTKAVKEIAEKDVTPIDVKVNQAEAIEEKPKTGSFRRDRKAVAETAVNNTAPAVTNTLAKTGGWR